MNRLALVVFLALGYWARESLMKTTLNRSLFGVTVFTLLAQGVLTGALSLTGVAPVASVALNFFLWFAVVGVASITIERRLWPSALGYGLGLFACLVYPDVLLLIMSACHGILTLNGIAVWGPQITGRVFSRDT